MKDNVLTTPEYKKKRPRKQKEFTTEEINNKIERETRLATHRVKLFFINNIVWIIPLSSFIIVGFLVDLYITLRIWHNPAIIFNQFKAFIQYTVAYILGLYTDEIRRKITKH